MHNQRLFSQLKHAQNNKIINLNTTGMEFKTQHYIQILPVCNMHSPLVINKRQTIAAIKHLLTQGTSQPQDLATVITEIRPNKLQCLWCSCCNWFIMGVSELGRVRKVTVNHCWQALRLCKLTQHALCYSKFTLISVQYHIHMQYKHIK